MSKLDFSGSADITDEGIKKHFKNIDTWQTIFELTWNGFDAGATEVNITTRDADLGGTESVTIVDNGSGIDFLHAENNFKKFNDSAKKEVADQHGSHGRGRLAFYRICAKATWYTRFEGSDAIITINASNIKDFIGREVEPSDQHPVILGVQKGTCVELSEFKSNLPEEGRLAKLLSTEFGWFLALNSDRCIRLNGVAISVPNHEIHCKDDRAKEVDFNVKVIRWDDKPSSEKSYIYLLNDAGKVVYKELSSLNNKPDFYTSVYVSSPLAESFSSGGDDVFAAPVANPDSQVWKLLIKSLNEFTQTIYEEFLRRYVDAQIEKFDAEGMFPEYEGMDATYAAWRLENVKSVVRSVYVADPSLFNSLKKKQKKIIVRLLDKISVSNENDSLFEVLESVLDLDGKALNALADQLQRTKLENIISTIESLQKRQSAVQMLRDVMNYHYKDVLETPDLQGIIEANTWLFGPRYETLGAEEDTFKKVAKSLRDSVRDIDYLTEEDLDEDTPIEGAQRQSDLFLARKIPTLDSTGKKIYRCVIVEIKKPSISLNIKHLRQLDDYAAIIKKHPEFGSEHMHFELILIGRKISDSDTEIASRLNGQLHKGEMGLVTDDGRSKRYVKNWYTILDDFELTNGFMLEQLCFQRDSFVGFEKDELVGQLQKGVA